MRRRHRLVALALAALPLVAQAAEGEWQLAWGVSSNASQLGLRWDGDLGERVGWVDADGDLQLGRLTRRDLPELRWVPADGPVWSLESRRFSGRSLARLQRELVLRGQRFPVDAEASSALDFDAEAIGWTWWTKDEARAHAFALGFGLARYRIEARVDAAVEEAGRTRRAEGRLSEASWLPQLRLGYAHQGRSGRRFSMEMNGLAKPSGGLSGHAVEARVGVDLWIAEAFGLGLRYQAIDVDLRREGLLGGNGGLRYRGDGPALALMLRWP